MAVRRLCCGLDVSSAPDINSTHSAVISSGYDYFCCPIVHPRFRREFISGKALERPGAFTRPDMLLTSQDWTTMIVAKISPYLEVDSTNEVVRKNSERALEQELTYASHLGVSAVMLKLKSTHCANVSRIIHNKVLAGAPYQGQYHVWVHVPIQPHSVFSQMWLNNERGDDAMKEESTWEWWNAFRGVCNWERRVQVALELTADLPGEDVIRKWMGEPIKCIVIPTHIFMSNKKGFPVLSQAHQKLVHRFMTYDVQVIISGANRHEHVKLYQQYIDFLYKTQPPDDPVAQFARGYEDYLQCPLQPLMDNLESQTYEIFEKDPIKYKEYQRAIMQALVDRVPDEEKMNKVTVLMVLGAGRGPLVRASLSAAERCARRIRIYAVEKNPNAVVTLYSQQDEMWGDKVVVVSSDMRTWKAPELADIMVSELLGSFGDNELSPECLDGAQKFMKPDGISIPQSYTSYLGPIQSSKLYNEVRQCKERDKLPVSPFEMPYVVHLHNCIELAKPQPLFTFNHPNKDAVVDNTRYSELVFDVTCDSVLTGLAGYFEATLYKDIMLSIVPSTHSPGMFSWFPLLFPIKDPLPLSQGVQLVVNFWRLNNARSVWYEWCITKPFPLPIHNPNGRSYTIGL